MAGELLKRSKSGPWNSRWFVLTEDGLYYFKKPEVRRTVFLCDFSEVYGSLERTCVSFQTTYLWWFLKHLSLCGDLPMRARRSYRKVDESGIRSDTNERT